MTMTTKTNTQTKAMIDDLTLIIARDMAPMGTKVRWDNDGGGTNFISLSIKWNEGETLFVEVSEYNANVYIETETDYDSNTSYWNRDGMLSSNVKKMINFRDSQVSEEMLEAGAEAISFWIEEHNELGTY